LQFTAQRVLDDHRRGHPTGNGRLWLRLPQQKATTIAAPSATSQTNADRETPPAAAKLLEPRRRFVGRSLTYSGSNNLPPRRCQHALG
jgi:hypothetical protein